MKNILIILIAIVPSFAFAHGEDSAGPHSGFIKMPGAFHLELVPVGKREFKLYLLDMNWKNPSMKDSSVSVSYAIAKKMKATCTPSTDFYRCQFPISIDLSKKGVIYIESQREGQKGNEVFYQLPLKLIQKDMTRQNDSHSKHH
jgi:hypothetical protein